MASHVGTLDGWRTDNLSRYHDLRRTPTKSDFSLDLVDLFSILNPYRSDCRVELCSKGVESTDSVGERCIMYVLCAYYTYMWGSSRVTRAKTKNDWQDCTTKKYFHETISKCFSNPLSNLKFWNFYYQIWWFFWEKKITFTKNSENLFLGFYLKKFKKLL